MFQQLDHHDRIIDESQSDDHQRNHRNMGAKAVRLRSLTERERQVFDLLGGGLGNRQIASRLGVAERTVKAHVTQVMTKVGVNRTEAAILSFMASRSCHCGNRIAQSG
ncbi:response regulator transcription factor [Micromonospora sp. D93]|uniref:helix-turn-helix domain-containing protein n=1 Tax=Micromonospora sp. D93 TaxID=2824886 RepID=UPI001B35C3BC|nr:LuxR C-terminal-related transcriptional regulator [Micromonospora sp. D93]MBQ1018397.1 response regulator transcription factor [Micromonospora sp. D93]